MVSGGFGLSQELPVNINYQFGTLGFCKMCRVVFDKGPITECMKGLSHLSEECFPSDCSVNFKLNFKKKLEIPAAVLCIWC